MARLVDRLERILLGATAEEAVQQRIALIDRRVDAAFARMLAGLDEPDASDDGDSQETEAGQ
jgi:hypothetical protein